MSTDQEMTYGTDYKYIPMTSIGSGSDTEVAPDVWCHTIQIVNIVMIGSPEQQRFVLIDAGMPGSAEAIIAAVENRFGSKHRPEAIILTHGHFDHVGAIIELAEHWKEIPIYANELELPFLTGQQSYPAPDPTVEGGLVAKMSFLFPNTPIDLGECVRPLPANGVVPHLPEFRWIHTPGHAPGHVSFFRESDRTLIAGDAFVTVRQDSLYKVLMQEPEVHGPPRYLTTDWKAAKESVLALQHLQPSAAVTGHGEPMRGEALTNGLKALADHFDQLAVPDYGNYVQ
ncbi:MBL fold metallo-hydrolase [Paenibacillus sp. OAS669]|uniref:MBL fold metallo-hydrolase n=1 Tax=Paenibacillus sp. OAS669 TaxID=2663821 RepID=UPI001A060091|nr:MBL fold metallo-hydrolase [Paenibacillus sp. OAS669]MBE1446952.1 glyoxylase-like metal-dependent hydrolase (beta-lactamase superfamily II) [Paenibacillus sp. OAS669]